MRGYEGYSSDQPELDVLRIRDVFRSRRGSFTDVEFELVMAASNRLLLMVSDDSRTEDGS